MNIYVVMNLKIKNIYNQVRRQNNGKKIKYLNDKIKTNINLSNIKQTIREKILNATQSMYFGNRASP